MASKDTGTITKAAKKGSKTREALARFSREYLSDRSGKTAFDEVFENGHEPRSIYRRLLSVVSRLSEKEISRRQRLQNLSLINQGITFAVYGDTDGIERVWPFDFVPRIITAQEWQRIEAGLVQRVTALNLFLMDVYHDQRCLTEKVVPAELILSRPEFRRELMGIEPPRRIFTHIVGTDLIRDGTGDFMVLEDNSRCPSGVSYVLENRDLLSRIFPEFFSYYPVRGVDDYPNRLLETMHHVAPRSGQNIVSVVLSPGIYNSAYFEHSFLAREMGAILVEGNDLIVEDNTVYMRTTQGRQRVDVVYRRVDDDYLDSLTFRRESLLGVPGIINAYRAGNVALINAPGCGVADDKAVYAYVPELIRFYLDEEPILPQVPTYMGFRSEDYQFMRENIRQLVIKPTGNSGGYGMILGPFATRREIDQYLETMKADPGNYIGQPLVQLSTHPTYVGNRFEPRRIDLRPFILYGDRVRVLPGGLTRVALRPGSFVVNSSQGGGSKDTWVLGSADR